ncbi:hypothetical protein IVB18_45660 [Bradyrhizobium sp. 186]|uniref:hypothetical protein n=1 Tax=Bradyrhizobium sp. 186 TaxID=2782654 RepID=UPI00200079A9|nr:hypothetical protein [Bradyrhizobium sp. 186]UPK35184.1 hypothetical protein IVB18_45660 [Bradyrhizobium sp. 186]
MTLRVLFPIAMTLLLAGCGSEELSCSSSTALETVGNIARKEMAKDPMGAMIDHSRTSFRVEDIRKQSGNGNSISCAANLYYSVVPTEANAQRFTKDALEKIASTALDITYTVEKLDKGGIYVTVHGL